MSFLANFGITYFADKQEQARIAALPEVTDDAVVKPSRPKSSRQAKSTPQHVDTPDSSVTALSKAKARLTELEAVDVSGRSTNAIKRHKGKLAQARKAVAAAHAALYVDVAEGKEEEEEEEEEEEVPDVSRAVAASAVPEQDERGEEQRSPVGTKAAAPEPGWLLAVNVPKTEKKLPAEKPAEEPVEKPVEGPVEKPTEKVIERPAEEPAKKLDEKPIEEPEKKPAERPLKKPAVSTAETLSKKLAESTVTKAESGLISNAAASGKVRTDQRAIHPAPVAAAAGSKKNDLRGRPTARVNATRSTRMSIDTRAARQAPVASRGRENHRGDQSPVHVEHGPALHVLKACSAINCRPKGILVGERNPYALNRRAPRDIVQKNQLRQQALFQTPTRPSRSLSHVKTPRAAANDSRSRSLSPDRTPRAAANDSTASSPVTEIITRDPFSADDFSGITDLNGYPMTHAEFRNATLRCLQHIRQGSPLWEETKKQLWGLLGQDQFYGLSGTDYTYRQMFAMLGKDVLGVDTEENDKGLEGQEGDVKSKAAGGQ